MLTSANTTMVMELDYYLPVPKPGFIIKAPEELVTEEHPLLFKPFVQSEFMKFLHSSESTKNALKVYC